MKWRFAWWGALALFVLAPATAQQTVRVVPDFVTTYEADDEVPMGEKFVLTVHVWRNNHYPGVGGQQEVKIEFSDGPFAVDGPASVWFGQPAPADSDQTQHAAYTITPNAEFAGRLVFNITTTPGPTDNPLVDAGSGDELPVAISVLTEPEPPRPVIVTTVLPVEDARGMWGVISASGLGTLGFILFRRRP